MALKKTFVLKNRSTGDYIRIKDVQVDIEYYMDEQARRDMPDAVLKLDTLCLTTKQLTADAARTAIYAVLKLIDDFKGSEDV